MYLNKNYLLHICCLIRVPIKWFSDGIVYDRNGEDRGALLYSRRCRLDILLEQVSV